ncbi:hypothetical protein JCM8097_005654 [Rhodosporidiobolus ruineniae]
MTEQQLREAEDVLRALSRSKQRADDVLEYLSSTFLAPRFRDLAIGHLEAKEFDAAAALYRLLLKRNHKPIWSDSGPTDLYYRAHRALESLSDMLNLLRDPQVPPFSIDVAAGWGRYIDHDAPFPADCLISHAGEGIPVVAHLLPKQSSGASGAAAEGLDAVLLPEQVRALHGEQIFELGDAGMVERRDPGWTERVRIAKATDFTVSYGQDGVGRYTLRRVFPPPPSSRSSSLPGSSTSSPSSSRSTFASLLANPAPLATGSSGSVYRARTQTGTELALKYGLDEDCDEEIEEEGRLLALLNAAEPALAPRLIGVYRGGYLRERVVMIMEWGGEWVKNMDDLSREDRGKIYSLFLTLHSLGYIHGDPRLANILRDETTKAFKLIDFGWSSRHDCEGEKECEELKEVKEWLDV